MPASVSVVAAPVHTSALRASGPTRAATPSEREDVAAVDDRGRQPQRRPSGVQRARAGSGEDQDEPGRGERQRDGGAPARPLAPERDGGHGDDRGERVEEQRQQRGVEALQRGEVAAGLGAVADGAEREGDADVAPRQRPQARGRASSRPRTARTARRRARTGRPAACRRSRPPRRRACRRSPSRRRRRRRRGRGGLRSEGMRPILAERTRSEPTLISDAMTQ